MHDHVSHDAEHTPRRAQTILVTPESARAAAVAAAAEAIAAEAAADVAAEAAITAAAAVTAAFGAAVKASATAQRVATKAAEAAAVAVLAGFSVPAGSPDAASQRLTDDKLREVARASADTVEATAIAAALAVAKVAAAVAEAAACAAADAAQAARLVEAQLRGVSAASTGTSATAAPRVLHSPIEAGPQLPATAGTAHAATTARWSTAPIPGALGLSVEGELDVATAPLLAAAFADRPADYSPGTAFVLDLRGVTFLDLRGLRAVADVGGALAAAGQQLHVLPSSAESVRRMLVLADQYGWWPPVHPVNTAQ